MRGLQPIPTRYNGRFYRSRTEARWAVFFDVAGIAFQYEPEGYVIREGAYLPDFWLPGQNMFLEVKGLEPTVEERAKCASLSEAAECDMLLAIGQPAEEFQLIWFDRGGEREDRYVFAHDRYRKGGFWLVANDVAHPIGGASRIPYGPVFDTLRPAYDAAVSAGFERGLGRFRFGALTYPEDSHIEGYDEDVAA